MKPDMYSMKFRLPLRYHPKSVAAKVVPINSDALAKGSAWEQYKAVAESAGNALFRLQTSADANGKAVHSLWSIDPLLAVAFAEGSIESRWGRRNLLRCAANKGDKFFIRLGRILSEARKRKPQPRSPMALLDALFVHHWIDPDERAPDLCFFTDSALADLAAIVLQENDLSNEAVTKARQRLRLRKAHRLRIHTVIPKNGFILAT